MEIVLDGLIYEYQPHGGISRLYHEILPRLGKLDPSIQISLLTCGRVKQDLPVHPTITPYALFPIGRYLRPGRLWWPVLPRARALVLGRWLGRAPGQIWHSTYYTRLPDWAGPEVVMVVDMIPERYPELFRERLYDELRHRKRQCVLSADVVLCISETTRTDVLSFYDVDPKRTYVMPLAQSAAFRLAQAGEVIPTPPTLKPFLLYIGERHHYKNFMGFLRAYRRWARQPEVDLVVVGRPWSRAEQRALAEWGITQQVHLLTRVEDDGLRGLYHQAAALVYPSLYEGFGIPLLEALACGCPIVAARIPSTVEVAGDCPIYFEHFDEASIQVALDGLLTTGRNPESLRRGLEWVKRYSWDTAARQLLDVYTTLGAKL